MNPDISHFRFYTYTRLRLSISAKDIFEELQRVWGDDAPSYSAIRKWKSEFHNGERTAFEDTPRAGRPSTSRTDAKIEEVKQIIDNDP